MFLMCRPTRFPMPPIEEQTNNTKEHCPFCNGQIWVSDKKREMIKLNPSFQLVCMDCVALREKLRPDLRLRPSPIIDINKMEGNLPEVIEQCEKLQEDFVKENEGV